MLVPLSSPCICNRSLRQARFPGASRRRSIQPKEVKFVPDQKWIDAGLKQAAGISPSLTLPDWTIKEWDIKPLVYALAPGIEYSGYAFEFTASRNVLHYILKVIFPSF
jgi:hypothetical protein